MKKKILTLRLILMRGQMFAGSAFGRTQRISKAEAVEKTVEILLQKGMEKSENHGRKKD